MILFSMQRKKHLYGESDSNKKTKTNVHVLELLVFFKRLKHIFVEKSLLKVKTKVEMDSKLVTLKYLSVPVYHCRLPCIKQFLLLPSLLLLWLLPYLFLEPYNHLQNTRITKITLQIMRIPTVLQILFQDIFKIFQDFINCQNNSLGFNNVQDWTWSC